MKRRITADGLSSKKSGLIVYLQLDVGMTKRFVAVRVPWPMVADEFEGIANGAEGVFLQRIKADADVQYLPLETWE